MPPQDEETTLVSTFTLEDGLFGISTLEVQEVVPVGRLTPVHHANEFITGIINLRGQIVTVIDLSRKLGLVTQTQRTLRHILIVSWQGETVGLMVDAVADVIPAEMDDLSPSPANITAAQQRFFKGVCQAEDRLVTILDLDEVLSEESDEIKSPGGG
jgi:purine-binding chemotaxis protein CheW